MKFKDAAKPSGPVIVGNISVRVDRDLCIGAATCNSVAHKAFGLDDESKSVILATAEEDSEETILEAARACPVAAIIVERISTSKTI